jgi:hypothetical protein
MVCISITLVVLCGRFAIDFAKTFMLNGKVQLEALGTDSVYEQSNEPGWNRGDERCLIFEGVDRGVLQTYAVPVSAVDVVYDLPEGTNGTFNLDYTKGNFVKSCVVHLGKDTKIPVVSESQVEVSDTLMNCSVFRVRVIFVLSVVICFVYIRGMIYFIRRDAKNRRENKEPS